MFGVYIYTLQLKCYIVFINGRLLHLGDVTRYKTVLTIFELAMVLYMFV